MKRKHSLRPDSRDQRDFIYKSKLRNSELPPRIDLRKLCSPIVDQGQYGTCTENATISGAFEFLELQEIADQSEVDVEELAKSTFARGSRLFGYQNLLILEGTPTEDAGGTIRNALKAQAAYGVCRESTWDYTADNFLKTPSPDAYAEAAKHKISSYYRIVNLADMKKCLAEGYPFVMGIQVYNSFESDEVAKTGMVPMPLAHEKIQGGHAVCCVGYDDSLGRLIVRNSWGVEFGDRGYFYLPYEFAENPNLTDDCWMLIK